MDYFLLLNLRIVLRPYLQCCRCEKPFGCLQLILRLYLRDHLCLRLGVCLLGRLERVLFDMFVYIYIYIICEKYTYYIRKKSGLCDRGLCPPLSSWPTALWFFGRAGRARRAGQLRQASNLHWALKCAAVDCARVSRRNDIPEFFLQFAHDWTTHFHIEFWVLEYVPSRENVQVNIGGHQAREEVTKHQCGCFVSIVRGEMFCASDDGLDETHIESKYAHEFGGDDTRCSYDEAIHGAKHQCGLDNSRGVNADLCFLGTGPK